MVGQETLHRGRDSGGGGGGVSSPLASKRNKSAPNGMTQANLMVSLLHVAIFLPRTALHCTVLQWPEVNRNSSTLYCVSPSIAEVTIEG